MLLTQDFHQKSGIPYTEFIAASIATDESIDVKMIVDAFKRMDSDNTGYITKKCFFLS